MRTAVGIFGNVPILTFRVEDPYPSQRAPLKTRYTRVQVQKALVFQAAVARRAHEAMMLAGVERVADGFVLVELTLFHPAPDSRKQRPYDVDNVVKSVLDGCNKVVWDDDWRVVKLDVELRRSAAQVHYAIVHVARCDLLDAR